MKMPPATPSARAASPVDFRNLYNRLATAAEQLIGHDVLACSARIAVGAIFFLSGRTKVDGLLSVSENAVALFADEYRLPLVSAAFAAHAATYAEHVLPLLLFAGLFTRFAALALLGMTAVIQVFVYPGAWPTHLTWATLLAYLVGRGGGALALDRWLGLR